MFVGYIYNQIYLYFYHLSDCVRTIDIALMSRDHFGTCIIFLKVCHTSDYLHPSPLVVSHSQTQMPKK
jgi:hypothetical protein